MEQRKKEKREWGEELKRENGKKNENEKEEERKERERENIIANFISFIHHCFFSKHK